MNRDNEMAVMMKKIDELDLFACPLPGSGRSRPLQLSGQPHLVLIPVDPFIPSTHV